MAKRKHRRQKEKAKKNPEISATRPALVEAIHDGIKRETGERATCSNKEEPQMKTGFSPWKWINDSANGVIAIFTIVIAGIGGLQACIYSVQLDESKISQRAYGYAKSANIIAGQLGQPLPEGAARQVDVTFGNSGQTWARKTSTSINFYFSPRGVPLDFSYPMEAHSPPILLSPQGETHLFKALSEEQYSALLSQKMKLFVYGEILYEDVFKTPHRTEYMFQLSGYSIDTNTGKLKEFLFWQGPTHNCADEDCEP